MEPIILKNISRFFVLTILILTLSATDASAQSERVTLSAARLSAQEAMRQIEEQTRYDFAYDRSVFDDSIIINFDETDTNLKAVLAKMFLGKNIDYRIHNDLIIITRALTPQPKYNSASRTPRTSDAYVPNALGGVAAAPVVREKTELQQPVVIIEPQPQPEPKVQYSAHIPAATYAEGYRLLPTFAIKTNLLYAAAALSPNLSLEVGVGKRSTLSLSGSYTWFGRKKQYVDDYKQFVHMMVVPEYRYWFCERFSGHFLGAHALYGRYNTSGYKIPLLFDKGFRYDGHAYGAGLSYGYHWAFAKRWGLEFNVGLGYAYMKYDKFSCETCATDGKRMAKHYFGPTRAGINLVFMIK